MIASNRKKKPALDGRYAAPALEKGLDILELLADEPSGLGQKQIADRMGKSSSEIFRMLMCLEARGFVRRNHPSETYTLTSRLFELSHRHPPTKRLLDAALPMMRFLSAAQSQSCHLSVLDGDHVLIQAQVESPRDHGFTVRVGARFPLEQTTSGQVLLAFEMDQVRNEVLSKLPEQVRESLEVQIDAIRKRGFERRRSRTVVGIIDLSIPVIDHAGRAVAALTVPYVSPKGSTGRRVAADQALEALREAAAKITELIGGGIPE